MSSSSSQLVIRDIQVCDAGEIATIYAQYVADTTISFEETPPKIAEMADRIAAGTQHYPWVVAELDGTVVGYAYGSLHRARPAYRWSVEVTVYVDRCAHRRGVGTRLYATLFERLRELGYHRAFSGIALPNASSEALHCAVGFSRIGVFERIGYKFGTWHDVAWYQRDLQPPDTMPAELVRPDGCG